MYDNLGVSVHLPRCWVHLFVFVRHHRSSMLVVDKHVGYMTGQLPVRLA